MLYLRLVSVCLRGQMQYRLSFVLDLISSALGTLVEFVSLVAVFHRFGSIGGWALPEVAFLYGVVEISFGTMDMLFSGFDPTTFSNLVRRGGFDQILLRPAGLVLQILGSQFVLRRLGRIAQGMLIFGYSLSVLSLAWTPARLAYLLLVMASTVAFFGGLFVTGATTCFWTVEASEAINIFTYGGSTLLSYPAHIYTDWLRRFFTFIIPGTLLVYYPALFFLGRSDPTGLPALMPFLAPLAGFGTLALAFAFWRAGLRRYTSTGT